MPPKKAAQKPSGKTVEKVKKKIVEDRTFGLKNKGKSKKVQKFVTEVATNVKLAGKSRKEAKDDEKRKAEKEAKKKAKETLEKEMGALFKAVVGKPQTVAKDVDPKSVLCEHFKAGACKYGKKCKFSHDLEIGRKVVKINLYHDPRQMAEDTIDKWDQAKLEEVVASQEKKRPNETKIVCKYFLDAVENLKYGWRWECPNGPTCIYKHALPEGFVFKKPSDKKSDEIEDLGPTIEEDIEVERKKLALSKCTPVTLERFLQWKEEKKKKKAAEVEEKRKAEVKKSGGKGLNVLSGRDLFIYDPSLFVDDEGAAENDEYETRTDQPVETEEKLYNSESDQEDEGEQPMSGGGSSGKDTEEKESAGKEENGKPESAKSNGDVEEKKDEASKSKNKKKKAKAKAKAKAKEAEKDKSSDKSDANKTTDTAPATFVNQELFLADEELPDDDDL